MVEPLFGQVDPGAPAAAGDQTPTPGQPLEITIRPTERPNNGPLFGTNPDQNAPRREAKALENAPSDEDAGGLRGVAKNLGSSLLTGASTLAGGMAGDTVEAARRIAAGIRSIGGGYADPDAPPGTDVPEAGSNQTTKQVLDQWNAERDKENQARIEQLRTAKKPSWARISDEAFERAKQRKIEALQINHGAPPTTEDVYKHSVAPKVGTYTPTSEWGKYGHAAIAGAVPGLVGGPMGVLAGGLGGASSQFMENNEANPFWSTAVPLGVGAVTPSVVKSGSTVRRSILGKNEVEQQKTAAQMLVDQASDPEKALKLAQERAGMPDETLAESTVRGNTGDTGLARTQDALLTARQSEMTKANQQFQNERMGAMSNTLERISPDSDPGTVSAAVQQHLDHLNETANAAPQPVGSHAEVAGANLVEAGQARHDTHMQAYEALKKSVNPEGNMQAWTGDLNDAAAARLRTNETQPYKTKLGPVATEYLGMAAKMPDILKLNDLIDFDQNITQGMKQTHDTVPADYGVLSQLKGQVKDAMNKALENQHKAEQSRVRDGTLNPEDTFASRFERERDDWLARKKASPGAADAGSAGPADAGAAGSVPPVHGVGPEGGSGAAAAPGARPGVGAAGDAGGPGGTPGGETPFQPVTPEAARRLALSNEYYGKIKDTYGKNEVGKALDTEFGGQSKMKAADVAQKAFVPGPKGFETANLWLTAGGPEGLTALKDIALGRLQAELKGKPLDPKNLEAFTTKHADALRAINEGDAKANPGQNRPWSEQFNDAAEARSAVHEFEDSAAAKFLGKEPGDVVNQVGTLLKGKDSEPLRDLIKQAEQLDGAPDGPIVSGLRRAGAQGLQDNFEQAGIKNIRGLLADRKDGLRALFGEDAVAQMDKVNDSIDKSATVQALANRDTPGSPTAPRAQAIEKLNAQLKATTAKDVHNGVSTVNVLVIAEMAHQLYPALAAGDLKALLGASLGAAGLFFVKPMLENALRKRGADANANIMRMFAQGFASRDVGAAMMKQVLDERGRPNQQVIDTLADALVGTESSTQREKRASGGAVFDHVKAAKHMVDMVDKVRKRDTEITKPLLKAHDNVVAQALAIANRSI